MTISFIGAGKVGTSLGLYFKNKQINVLGYYSRSFESAKKANQLTGSRAFKDLSQALEADIVMITTNDDAISQVANTISSLANTYTDKVFAHTSGALTSSALEALQTDQSHVVSLHPVQAFTAICSSVAQLKNTVFSIEGDPKAIPIIEALLTQCGNRFFILDQDQKPLYHASACVLSNYLVTLLSYGFSMLDHIGLPQDLAAQSFFPLIEATLANVKAFGPSEALTGPIARGDLGTIQAHLGAFDINNFSDTELYTLMGLSTLSLAKKSKLKDQDTARKMLKLLEGKNENQHY